MMFMSSDKLIDYPDHRIGDLIYSQAPHFDQSKAGKGQGTATPR